jgi:6,7-dimethyl-8-ribityllumazine synthase
MGKEKKRKSGKIAIAASRFNKEITEGLLNGALAVLHENNFDQKDVKIVYCPGAFEIPLTAKQLCQTGKYCGIICLGAVIKGETAHFEYISDAVTRGILQLNLEFGIPVSFGVLTCYTDEQALKRSGSDAENKGAEAANAVLEMIKLLKEI